MNDFAPQAQDDVTRALPHAIGIEKSLLSSMLQDPQEYIGLALENAITPDHFYLPAHASLFRILAEMHDQGSEIEFVSLVQILIDRGQIDRLGGPAAITDLYTYAPSPVHFRHHLAQFKDKFVLRSIIQNANEAIAQAYDAPEEVTDLLDSVEAKILAIREAGQNIHEEPTSSIIARSLDSIMAIAKHQSHACGLSTGFSGMDALGAFLKAGELFVVAARPSMGKTAFMMNVVEHFAVEEKRNTLIFSAEMTSDSLMQRALCSRSKFPIAAIAKHQHEATKGDLRRLQRASFEWASAPLRINDRAQITISEIRAYARRRHRERPLELIALDYLQYLRSTSKQATLSREREIAEISAGIKALAKELSVPVILLAQLNRGPESRSGSSHGVPRMSDLRESGAIEQDADMIGLLYREDYYAESPELKDSLAGRSKLILAKNRNGETGEVPLTFIGPFVRFEDGKPAAELPLQAQASRFDD